MQDADAICASIEPVVQTLQALALPSRTRYGNTAQHAYSDATMVASHLLALRLSNRNDSEKVIELAVAASFQGLMGGDLRSSKWLPSPSYIRKRLVCLDAALMLWRRVLEERHGSKLCWLWADSSVQAGHDWVQVKELSVHTADMQQVVAAMDHLSQAAMLMLESFLGEASRR